MKRQKHSAITKSFALIRRMDSSFFSCVILNGILRALMNFLPAMILAQVINRISEQWDFRSIMILALAGAVGIWILSVFQALAEKEVTVRSQNISYSFETLVSRTTMSMEYAQMESEETKKTRAQIKADRSWGSGFFGVTAKAQQIVQQLTNIAVAIIILVPFLIESAANENWYLFGAPLLMLALSVASSLFFDRFYSKRESAEMRDMTQTETNSRFYSMTEGNHIISYRNIKDILIYGATALIGPSVEEEDGKIHRHALRLSKLNFTGGLIKGGSSGLLLGLSYCMAAFCAYVGRITVGYIVQYAQALYQLSVNVSSFLQTKVELRVDADRLTSTLNYLELNKLQSQAAVNAIKLQTIKEIEYRDVSFTYPGSDHPAIEKLSVKINAGSKTAIVGRNGSGKTTLVKLLCRLYRPDQGTILLDGVDIWDYDEAAYRDLLAVVFQDFSLFSFSLGSVVASSEIYDDNRVRDALVRSGMGEWLRARGKGLETILYKEYENDGMDISGGEAQKIAIARAIYKDASLVILDEPTAALDPQAEYDIYTKLADLIGDKGVIYISHRLTSCRFCDEIIVMDNGHIAEQGKHSQLLDHNGRYAKMWNAQAQYYKVE